MRVLHLVKTSSGGRWALRQMTQLVRSGVEVHVAAPAGGPLLAQYRSAGVIVHEAELDFPVRQPWRLARARATLHRLVGKVRPDLIHSHFVGTTLTARWSLGRAHPIPRLFSVAGPLHLEHRVTRRGEIATAGPRDYWAGGCEWTCQAYRDAGVPANRVFLGRHGKDIDGLIPGEHGTLRAELGIGPKTFLVGMVALMYPPKRYLGYTRGIKGHEDLIDALALLCPHLPNLRGVMVGGAWGAHRHALAYERRIRDYARERCGDRITFLGTRADVPKLYPDFNVVVHPSHSENVGGAAESLLLGVPTIATSVGGFPDLVDHGVTGWLVSPRSPAEIAAAILRVYRDEPTAKAMALRGHDVARVLCDVRRNTAIMLDAYRQILDMGTV